MKHHIDLHVHLKEIRVKLVNEKPAFNMGFKVGPVTEEGGAKNMIEVNKTPTQRVPLSIAPEGASGKKAKVDGVPVWVRKSGDVTLEVAPDGMSAMVRQGTDGDSEIGISADADLGAGVETISDTVIVHTRSEKAVQLGTEAGPPEEDPNP